VFVGAPVPAVRDAGRGRLLGTHAAFSDIPGNSRLAGLPPDARDRNVDGSRDL
jgi:hypothetical protein